MLKSVARSETVARSIAAVVLGSVILAVGIWQGLAAWALGSVKVVHDAAPISCTGTTVGTTADLGPTVIDEGDFVLPMVRFQKAMECALTFHVVNGAPVDVAIEGVGLRLMGEDNPLGFTPRAVVPSSGTLVQELGSIDGYFRIDQGLAVLAGGHTRMGVVFVQDREPRYMDCARLELRVETVRLEFLGVRRDVGVGDQDAIAFHRGDPATCPR